MSIASFFSNIFGTVPHPAISAAPATTVAAVKTFANSESSKVIAGLKTTDIGEAVAADVAAMSSATLTGPEKFAAVVSNTVPLILKYASGGGIAAVEADVLGIAQGLVQEIYLDTASTSFGKLAAPLLRLLGI